MNCHQFRNFAFARQFANSRTRRFYSPALSLTLFIYLFTFVPSWPRLFISITRFPNSQSNIYSVSARLIASETSIRVTSLYDYNPNISSMMKRLQSHFINYDTTCRNRDPRDLRQVILINGFFIRDQVLVTKRSCDTSAEVSAELYREVILSALLRILLLTTFNYFHRGHILKRNSKVLFLCKRPYLSSFFSLVNHNSLRKGEYTPYDVNDAN